MVSYYQRHILFVEVCSALCWLFFLNSVHLVPFLTRSVRRSKVLAGLAQDTVALGGSGLARSHSLPFGLIVAAEAGGVWTWAHTPRSACSGGPYFGGRMLSQGRGRFSRA